MNDSLSHTTWVASQRLLALLALVFLSPLFLVLFVLVRLESKGKFLFRQERRGLNGELFSIYKIRTMAMDAETKTALGTTLCNPHVTRVGKVLRALKIDELPQLWNIIRGDMELVGPRPIPLSLDEYLTENIPGFEVRYAIRPGLTNLGQVCVLDNEVDDGLLDDWKVRFEAELQYIRRKSLTYDLVMLALTSLYVIRRAVPKVFTKRKVQVSPSAAGEATRVIRTPVSNLNYDGVIDRIATWIKTGHRDYICVVPVHSIIVGYWDRFHRQVLSQAGLCTADGMPVVWLQRLLGYSSASRVYGPTLMWKLLGEAEQNGWNVALLGGKEDRLAVLGENIKEYFPKLHLVEQISPPFRALTEEEDDALVDRLRQAKTDLLFVGLGCPKQERWMAEHSPRLGCVMIGVGAAFDFHAGAVRQAPSWIQRFGLEWLFRLAMEPRRLWKRYLSTNPVYLTLAAGQVLAHLIFRRSYQITQNQLAHQGELA